MRMFRHVPRQTSVDTESEALTGRQSVAKAKAGYRTTAAILVLGALVAVIPIGIGVQSIRREGFPTTLPSNGSIQVEAPGHYAVFEINTTGTKSIHADDVTVIGPSGQVIAVHRTVVSGTRISHSRQARQVGVFDSAGPGHYHVTAEHIAAHSRLGIGQPVSTIAAMLLLLGIVLAVAAIILAFVVFISTERRIKRAIGNTAR